MLSYFANTRNRARWSTGFLLTLLALFAVSGVSAQIVEKGVVTGQVRDASGQALSGTRGSIYNMATDQATEPNLPLQRAHRKKIYVWPLMPS